MTAAIIQARMGSARLPGKVLRQAVGKSFLEHLIERLSFVKRVDRIVVATSVESDDDVIEQVCRRIGVLCFRGSHADVLDRYYRAAQAVGAEVVVRITADCPLVDPSLVDMFIEAFEIQSGDWDLVTNRYPLTFPDGLDVDVMPVKSLGLAQEHATEPHQREHVIPYFWETGQRVKNIEHPDNLFRWHRWTVDYEEDANFVAAIFEALYQPGQFFGMQQILNFLIAHPELAAINARYLPKNA